MRKHAEWSDRELEDHVVATRRTGELDLEAEAEFDRRCIEALEEAFSKLATRRPDGDHPRLFEEEAPD